MAGAREVDEAVRSAYVAFDRWSTWPANERRNLLLRIAALLQEREGELSSVVTIESGIPTTFAPVLASALPADYFRYYAGWADKLEGSVIPVWPGDALDYTLAEPYGVVAIIVPWNGPLASIGMKVAPALAAGNCVILKPSEMAPFSSLRFAELCQEAGLPDGVLSVLPGGSETGDALVRHPGVALISFTGSVPVGRKIQAAAADNLTPLILELGGKSANIVFSDADLDAAVAAAVQYGVAALSGQGCNLPTRLLVENSIYDYVIEQVVDVTESLDVGLPDRDDTVIGPVIGAAHCKRILGFIDRGRAHGGRILTGGNRLGGDLADGFFIAPTIFGDVDPSAEIAQQEIFGPVLSVMRFRSETEAVSLANGTPFGLAAYLWTRDLPRAHRLARRLEAGTVAVNGYALVPPGAPFGGVKASGYGREGGRAGIEGFLRTKNVFVSLD
jgi:acyl-CoA reductase-like NAD-dependent aldehyde dehydrogenase